MFGYRLSYVLLRPHLILRGCCDEIKWAWQRVFRGWDDRVIWSVDCYISRNMPAWLRGVREWCGVPVSMYVGDFSTSTRDEDDAAAARWHGILDEMIAGFEAGYRAEMMEYPDLGNIPASELHKKILADNKLLKRALQLFAKYYSNLWT